MTENTPAKRYTPDDKRTGLVALLVTGSSTSAAEHTGIPRKTLENWRDVTDVELWGQLNREHGAQVDEIIAAELRTAVRTAASIEQRLLDRLEENAARIDPRDLPAAIKNVTAAKSQNTDKLLLLTGRATERVEHVDARDIIADIQKIVRPYVNSTAEIARTLEP